LGEHAEARKQIELALESDLRQFGPDHPNVAIRRSNLANILRALGEHAEARKQVELALESDLRQFGPDHPNVAGDRTTLAAILYDLGEQEEALQQIDRALEISGRSCRPGTRTFKMPSAGARSFCAAGRRSPPPRRNDRPGRPGLTVPRDSPAHANLAAAIAGAAGPGMPRGDRNAARPWRKIDPCEIDARPS
jgi:tetratricopeptide (TPR) repeat protein